MTINYFSSACITYAGITAAINAGTSGPSFDVSGFRIGSLSSADGFVATQDMTDVGGFVYQGSPSQLSYTIVDLDTIMWTVALDATVGNFQIGNVGICMPGNVLLCCAVFPTETGKYMGDPPTTVGNVLYYKILMRLANIAGLINVTIIESLTASLPEVPTQFQLPPSFDSPYDCYMVDNHTILGTPTTALRLNGNWYHSGHYSSAGMNDTVLPVPPTMFDVAVPITTLPTAAASAAVGFNPSTSTFVKMDSLTGTNFCIGLRVSSYQIVTRGIVQVDTTILGNLTPGAIYYVNTGVYAGTLTTIPNNTPIGVAIYTNYIWVDLEAFSHIGYATFITAGIVRWATQDETDESTATIDGPVVTPVMLNTWSTDGTLFNNLQGVGALWDKYAANINYTATKYNMFIRMAGTGSTTVALLSPTAGATAHGQGYKVWNNTLNIQNVITGTGNFVGTFIGTQVILANNQIYPLYPGEIVEFISEGNNWVVIDYYRIATLTSYGIAREATLLEAVAGVTTGPAPCFITPEDLAAALSGQIGTLGDIFGSFNIGSYIQAATPPVAGIGAAPLGTNFVIGATCTWTTYFEDAAGGALAIAAVIANEQTLMIPAGNWSQVVSDIAVETIIYSALDQRYSIVIPTGPMNTGNLPTITVPPGVWQIMFTAGIENPAIWSGSPMSGAAFWGPGTVFWLKRIS
jgi:hypothetical protein